MKPVGSGVEERPRPVVLTFAAFYLPGYKGGGPIRSVANLAYGLKEEFDFRIVTSDRDLGDRSPYPGIRVNAWQVVAGVRVFYLSPGPLRWWRIVRLLLVGDFDLIYLNSFWSRPFSMLPIWLRLLGVARRIPVLLAPRGEFSPGALGIKESRKRFYFAFGRFLGIYAGVTWHASTQREAADIKHVLGSMPRISIAKPFCSSRVAIASDLLVQSPPSSSGTNPLAPTKVPGSLNVVFVSRICRMKNLSAALEILAGVREDVHFNIYGPIEDTAYWAECRRLIKELPPNVRADYRGELPHTQVAGVFRIHQLLFLPTLGENFGHVIGEALMAGCPVLISDQTPWRQLREERVGWDLPLDQVALFQQAIQECAAMGAVPFEEFSRRASLFGQRVAGNPDAVVQHHSMFLSMVYAIPGNNIKPKPDAPDTEPAV